MLHGRFVSYVLFTMVTLLFSSQQHSLVRSHPSLMLCRLRSGECVSCSVAGCHGDGVQGI